VRQALLQRIPQLHQPGKLRPLVGVAPVRLVGGFLRTLRALARILHRQSRGDDQHLAQADLIARRQQHAAQARIQRQARQLAADRGELVALVDRVQLRQKLVTVRDRTCRRSLHERELGHVAQAERFHLQDDGGQRRAQDLRIGERRAALVILLVVQPDADAVGHAPAAAGALGRGRL